MAALVVILLTSVACQRKSKVPAEEQTQNCLNHCSGTWRACMTYCDQPLHCIECTVNAHECRERCHHNNTRKKKRGARPLITTGLEFD